MNVEEELLNQYLGKVEKIVDKYSRNSGEREDLIQEGMIGLLSAIRTFDESKNVSFSTYSSHCIKNRILDSIRNYDELPLDDEAEIPDSSLTPEETILFNDYLKSFQSQLSEFEYKVLVYMLDGYTTAKTADLLSVNVSSIYNANQRIRQKISANFNLALSVQADRK